MLDVLTQLVDFLWKGIFAYASTDEGRQELNDVFDAVEALGIDLPFYDASAEAEPVDISMKREGSPTDFVTSFREKHPEIFNKEN